MVGKIYKITYKIDGRIYIGQTKHSIKERVHEHFTKKETKFDKFCSSNNVENFIIEEVESIEADSQKELKILLDKREQYWIDYYKSFDPTLTNGFNCTKGGGGNSGLSGIYSVNYGRKHSKEVNKSKGRSGKEHYWYGKHHSEEAKKKMSDKHKLIPKEKHGMFGKKHNDETKKLLSIKRKEYHNNNHPKWMNNGIEEKLVIESEIDLYVTKGYMIGRKAKIDYKNI